MSRYLFPSDYMADPSAHVFGNRLYIYPSHDRESGIPENDNGDHFDMRDYHVLTLDDPDQGEARDLGLILDLNDIPWAGRQLWDSDVVEKDGRYYLIFSLKDRNDIFRLGVAIAERPEGPFIAQPDPIRGSYSIDPCAFRDDDGEVYIYFGGLWGGQLQRYRDNKALENAHLPAGDEEALPARVARMTPDLLQFAEEAKPVVITDDEGRPLRADDPHRFFEASWLHKHDGIYYFSYSTGDSHLICYATSTSPYGPFRFRGELLQPVVGWTTHHSICQWRGRTFLFHHDSVPSGGRTWLRSVKIAELEYLPDGQMRLK